MAYPNDILPKPIGLSCFYESGCKKIDTMRGFRLINDKFTTKNNIVLSYRMTEAQKDALIAHYSDSAYGGDFFDIVLPWNTNTNSPYEMIYGTYQARFIAPVQYQYSGVRVSARVMMESFNTIVPGYSVVDTALGR